MKSRWICAAFAISAVLCLPAHAGSCPQGTYEKCPDHAGGVEGPCQCVPIGSRPKYFPPQTIVNNTGAAPPPPASPKLSAGAGGTNFPACCSMCGGIKKGASCSGCNESKTKTCTKGIAADCTLTSGVMNCGMSEDWPNGKPLPPGMPGGGTIRN